jgi:hypothetical protein
LLIFFLLIFQRVTSSGNDEDATFPLYDALLPFLTLATAHGDTAREGMICLLGMRGGVRDWVGPGRRITSAVVRGITEAYVDLPASVSPEDGAGSTVLSLYDRLRFANAVAVVGGPRVAAALRREFETTFLAACVAPGLENANESAARAATWYARGVVQQLEAAPLVDAMVAFLLGAEGSGLSQRGQLLIERMQAPDRALALATLQLFDALLALHNKRVMNVLVIGGLIEGRHLARDGAEAAEGAAEEGLWHSHDDFY